MKRKEATPEQKAAAAERRARVKEMCKTISALSPDKRQEIGLALDIRNTEGHALSPYNQLLLHHQSEAVSVVGGFNQWRAIGRQVSKGSKALAIWIPTGTRSEPAPDEAGDDAGGPRFICGNVFDISQTEEITN